MTPALLAALHARCFTTPRPWSAAEFEALLATPGTFLCGDAQAMALGRVAAGEAELLTIAVAPECQRTGLGRARLAAFEAGARARAAEEAFLEVATDNAAACALYRAAGFELAGCRPRYYTAPDGRCIDALVMRKALSSQG
ncbi:GNAT family N-acetyltransferase [Rhodovulum sulfidophilum]|uniref:GNAT family N-acetyltransferase n=1 Tax=Rhodovulum sulfidophilum TaxID=35806 RepID=A0ABS1RS92_RHOSU|nr:GNAT family N-acetyltransferase [Rhodovulum sulfidophilum]MBL3608935.1 GNAT family N-acetyltransferase [Rhodovulum sulfidophilum]MCE8458613.1 GNAT family N-acetyltransferase [Rhodovulum sulfidophilum]